MGVSVPYRGETAIDFAWTEATGAIGDSVTVLPFVVAVAALTDLSLSLMLLWFGVFQIVWGLVYGVPISVEPMKALAALILAGTITTGEFLLAGLLLGVVLLAIGLTDTLDRVGRYIGRPVVRGIQFGVGLVLIESGVRIGATNLWLAGLAVGVALLVLLLGYWNLTAIVVLVLGGLIAGFQTGIPSPTVPTTDGMVLTSTARLTLPTITAAVGQLAMTVGNAALAASILLADYFDRDISGDTLSSSMGVMNLVALPFGALPMCHGSGGIAGKYAFGARTAGANVLLGVGYIAIALVAVGLVAAYPVSMLGVILVLIGLQLGRTSIAQSQAYPLVIGIGILGLITNLGVAFLVGILVSLFLQHREKGSFARTRSN